MLLTLVCFVLLLVAAEELEDDRDAWAGDLSGDEDLAGDVAGASAASLAGPAGASGASTPLAPVATRLGEGSHVMLNPIAAPVPSNDEIKICLLCLVHSTEPVSLE